MAYTTADLATIEAAILALAKGERVKSVSLPSGQSIDYADCSIEKLLALKKSISAALAVSAGTSRRQALVSTCKGF
jgi:hypothetical protein